MSSVSVIVIEKAGGCKELKVKQYNEDELYKKGGFKTPSDFEKHTIWKNIKVKNKSYNIHVYGKISGRANQENKYEFPPPLDNVLFFGSCVLVNKLNDDTPTDLTSKEWNSIYNQLYGGFDDLNGDESEESEDDDENLPKTKSGYMKDDFIVEDDFDETDSYDEESDNLSENPILKQKRRGGTNVPLRPSRKKAPTVFTMPDNEDDSDYTNELEEEEYID